MMDRATRVLELVEGAQALSALERNTWLDLECRGDAALRCEVEELLELEQDSDHDPLANLLPGDARTFIDRFKREVAQATQHAQAHVRHQELFDHALAELERRGARPERYRLEEPLGRGGMGEVHAAWDQLLRRRVALKRVRRDDDHLPSPGVQIRFLQEAQLTGQLEHPGVPTVYEIGVDAGRLFFTMPLVVGESLGDLLRNLPRGAGAWDHRRVLDTVLQAARAIAHAHERGIVHRDLKPANLMIGRFGAAYVMDWGVARVVDGERASELLFASDLEDGVGAIGSAKREGRAFETVGAGPLGTPSYMSPEQARSEGEVGPATDVYALGAILYEVLAGAPPFLDLPGEDGAPPSATEVTRRVQAGSPTPLSERAPGAPRELVAIAERAMQRDPGRRFAGAREIVEDLENYMDGRVVRSYETGVWAELRKWVRRNRTLATVGVTLLLAVAGAVTAAFVIQARREAEASEKVAQIMRLSSLQDAERLVRTLDLLWPVTPARLGELRTWRREALRLAGSAVDFEGELRAIEARASVGPDGGLDFLESSDAWWHRQLTQTIETLGQLVATDDGPLFGSSAEYGLGVSQRIALAEASQARAADPDFLGAWREAQRTIETSPRYGGLELAVDADLLPLGPDPASGLWFFAHLPSGTPAELDGDGAWRVRRETGVVLVLIPGGSSWMGAQRSDPAAPNLGRFATHREQPVNRITLEPYLISRFELTTSQWERLAGFRTGSFEDPEGNMPADSISWWEGAEVLARFELDFPTEAQWEHAARAGSEGPWWFGQVEEDLAYHDLVNFSRVDEKLAKRYAEKYGRPRPPLPQLPRPVDVGSANPFGLVNVNGNLSEWSREAPGSYESATFGPEALREIEHESLDRVVRGGSLTTLPYHARVSYRELRPGDVRGRDCGVRPIRRVRRVN
jgi:serine/threonine protein kinase/formylglycine-generating enzyme required for sulfatase activity